MEPLSGYTFTGKIPLEDRVLGTQAPEKREDAEVSGFLSFLYGALLCIAHILPYGVVYISAHSSSQWSPTFYKAEGYINHCEHGGNTWCKNCLPTFPSVYYHIPRVMAIPCPAPLAFPSFVPYISMPRATEVRGGE